MTIQFRTWNLLILIVIIVIEGFIILVELIRIVSIEYDVVRFTAINSRVLILGVAIDQLYPDDFFKRLVLPSLLKSNRSHIVNASEEHYKTVYYRYILATCFACAFISAATDSGESIFIPFPN